MENILYKNDLAVIRTLESITRTYLAQIRTTSIFCGILVMLIKKIPKIYVNLLLSIIIILNIILTINYYLIFTKHFTLKKKGYKRDFFSNILFSIVLIFILFMIMFIY